MLEISKYQKYYHVTSIVTGEYILRYYNHTYGFFQCIVDFSNIILIYCQIYKTTFTIQFVIIDFIYLNI